MNLISFENLQSALLPSTRLPIDFNYCRGSRLWKCTLDLEKWRNGGGAIDLKLAADRRVRLRLARSPD